MFIKEDFIPFRPQHSAIRNLMLLLAYFFIFSWIVGLFLPNFKYHFLALHSNPKEFVYTPWTIITYFFGSMGFFDLLGHCLWLYFFGRISEDLLGKRKIYNFFISAGVIAAICYILIAGLAYGNSHAIFSAAPAVAAVVYGTAIFRPYYEVYLFGAFKVQLRWIAVFRLFLDVLALFNMFPGEFESGLATLIGGLVGVIGMMHTMGTIRIPILDALSDFRFPKRTKKPSRTASVKINKDISKERKSDKSMGDIQSQIDEILDKINKEGYNSLTDKEKQTLFNNSQEI